MEINIAVEKISKRDYLQLRRINVTLPKSETEVRELLGGVNDKYELMVIRNVESPFLVSSEGLDDLNKIAKLTKEYESEPLLKYVPILAKEKFYGNYESAFSSINAYTLYEGCTSFSDVGVEYIKRNGARSYLPMDFWDFVDFERLGQHLAGDTTSCFVDDGCLLIPVI